MGAVVEKVLPLVSLMGSRSSSSCSWKPPRSDSRSNVRPSKRLTTEHGK